jgi:hypothetical protein
MIVYGIELEALVHLLRDRRFQQNVITGMIGLAALVAMAREGRTRTLARVLAWDKRQRGRIAHASRSGGLPSPDREGRRGANRASTRLATACPVPSPISEPTTASPG